MRRLALAIGLALTAACDDAGPVQVKEGPALPFDHPDLAQHESSRDPRRISHRQLQLSIQAALGTKWTEDGLDVLFALGPTLGDPDYEEITEENLDPSPLYVKFMEDLANAVCADAPEAVLNTKSDPAENVAALKLRLHGEWIPPGDPALEPLVALEQSDGMRAVCVALLGAPEFYLY